MFGTKVPGHTTRAPPVGFKLVTHCIQLYYAIANLALSLSSSLPPSLPPSLTHSVPHYLPPSSHSLTAFFSLSPSLQHPLQMCLKTPARTVAKMRAETMVQMVKPVFHFKSNYPAIRICILSPGLLEQAHPQLRP